MKTTTKLILTSLIAGIFAVATHAQPLSIAPAHAICDYELGIKLDTQLKNKMMKALTAQGISTLSHRARFALVPTVGILSEQTISDLPPKTEMNLDISFALVDALTGNIFESCNFEIQAKGTNKKNAIYNGVASISLDMNDFQRFIQESKRKVIGFYERSIDNILLKAKGAAEQGDYEQALYILDEVPSEISSYNKVVAVINKYYKGYEEKRAGELYRQAEATWLGSPNLNGAKSVGHILAQMPVQTKYDKAVKILIQKVEKQLSEQERKEWILINYELERRHQEQMNRIDAWRDISMEYARNQPIKYTKVVLW